MAATRTAVLWGVITDLIAVNRNADDEFIHILKYIREPHAVAAAGRGRQELEKERQGLLRLRDMCQEDSQ